MTDGQIKFTFETDQKDVSAAELVATIQDILEAFAPFGDWRIRKLSMASPFKMEASAGGGNRSAVAFVKRVRSVQDGRKPRGRWTESSVKAVRAVERARDRGFKRITIAAPNILPAKIDTVVLNRLGHHLDKAVNMLRVDKPFIGRSEIGEVRGYFEQIRTPKNQPAAFSIRDEITDRTVRCTLSDDHPELFDLATKSFRNTVVARGVIHLSRDGLPTSIIASALEIVRRHVIPWSEWKGVDITDGEDSVLFRVPFRHHGNRRERAAAWSHTRH